MMDPFGSFQGFMNQLMGAIQNPTQSIIQKRLGLSPNWMQNPQGEVQRLMNDGRMTQSQYNQLQQVAGRIMNQPQFRQFTQQMQGGHGQK